MRNIHILVRERGLEPPRPRAHAPKACVSTNSTTRANSTIVYTERTGKIKYMTTKPCDIVMEGGGVKGIGLAGAAAVLHDHGYEFRRIAGTSSGAIIGSLLVAGYAGE